MKVLDKLTDELTVFWCPGCKENHHVNKSWTILGTEEKPTIKPSVLTRGVGRCHLFITDGKIKYLTDCTHEMAGKTVNMEDLP